MALILASGSPTRAAMLTDAGLVFERVRPEVDERRLEAEMASENPGEIAERLAGAKALDVSRRHPGALVVGADQTLALGSERFHKPESLEAAETQIARLAGRTHELHAAVVVARDGAVLFRHRSVARMTMRPLGPAEIARYVGSAGEEALGSVGAYRIEGRGITLFEAIDGDHFTILGLPLLPLLAILRSLGETLP